MGSPSQGQSPDEDKKARWEFAFWIAHEILDIATGVVKFLCFVALALYLIISAIEGQLPGVDTVLRYLD